MNGLMLAFATATMLLQPGASDAQESWAGKLRSMLPQKNVPLDFVPGNLQSLATAIVLEHIPREYEDNRGWGQTKEVVRGLKVWRDGMRIKTKRRRKPVNHGTWKKYRLRQVDPEKHLRVRITDIHENEEGIVQFQIELDSRLDAYARLSQWERGVRLFSISMQADAWVTLQLMCSLDLNIDLAKFPPDVILAPVVTDADVKVARFDVRQVSKLDGFLARELGDGLKRVLLKKVDEKRDKLVSKINRQIEKNEDKLRFSLHDALTSKWQELVEIQNDQADTEKPLGNQQTSPSKKPLPRLNAPLNHGTGRFEAAAPRWAGRI